MKTEVIIVLPYQHQKEKDVILKCYSNKHLMHRKVIKIQSKFSELF